MDFEEALVEALGEVEGKENIAKICNKIIPKYFTARDIERKLKDQISEKQTEIDELSGKYSKLEKTLNESSGKTDPETAKQLKELNKLVMALQKENTSTKVDKFKLEVDSKLKDLPDEEKESILDRLQSKNWLDDPEKFDLATDLVDMSLDMYERATEKSKAEFEKQQKDNAYKNMQSFANNGRNVNNSNANNLQTKEAPKWNASDILK